MYGNDSEGVPAAEMGVVGFSSVAMASIKSVSLVFCGAFADDHVLRRHVFVNQVLAVGELQGAGEIDADAEHSLPFEFARFLGPANDRGETVAGDVLRRHPAMVARLAGPIDLQQMRMGERHHRLHRFDERLHFLLVLPEVSPQHLQGDGRIGSAIVSVEDVARLASGERRGNLVMRKGLAHERLAQLSGDLAVGVFEAESRLSATYCR